MKEFIFTGKDVARFWGLVDRGEPNLCWPWKGFVNQDGYASFSVFTNGRSNILAHRLSLILSVGESDGCLARQRCENRICCNPAHIYWATRSEIGKSLANRIRKATIIRTIDIFPDISPLLEARFWDRVDIKGEDDCWLWRGGLTTHGYGLFYVSLLGFSNRSFLAHRFSLALTTGTLPKLLACHKCDVPACVNPTHLYWGTFSQNHKDAVDRGLYNNFGNNHSSKLHPESVPRGNSHYSHLKPELVPRGERKAGSVFTAGQVREIRTEYARGGVSQLSIAKRFGVNESTIGELLRRETWKHVE